MSVRDGVRSLGNGLLGTLLVVAAVVLWWVLAEWLADRVARDPRWEPAPAAAVQDTVGDTLLHPARGPR